MKNVTAGIVLAALLFAAAAVCRSEARLRQTLADAHERFATLRPGEDAGSLDASTRVWNRVAWTGGSSLQQDVQRYQATVSYWTGRFDELTTMSTAAPAAATDPDLLLLAANAAFREARAAAGDQKADVERLDRIVQAYAEVLRRDPRLADAAFNFEYASRMRDAVAKAPAQRGGRRDRQRPAAEPAPAGRLDATVHGRVGAPAQAEKMGDFKTIAPQGFKEREEQDPGTGKEIQRKG